MKKFQICLRNATTGATTTTSGNFPDAETALAQSSEDFNSDGGWQVELVFAV